MPSGKVVLHIVWGRLGDQLGVTGFPAIRIGEGTSIMSRSYFYANDSGCLIINSRRSINHNVLLGAVEGEIAISNEVLIDPSVVLRASDHVFASTKNPIRNQGQSPGCVVDVGSIVTHAMPPMSLYADKPARSIRSRLPPQVVEQ